MARRSSEFGRLLTEAVKRINLREDVLIGAIHDELGYALGKKGGHMLPKWREGRIPLLEDVDQLAREIANRTELDRAWFSRFLNSAKHPTPELLCDEIFGFEAERMTQPDIPPSEASEDWGDAPAIYSFHGRQKELEQLEYWIVVEQCHLVGVLGVGGIGKTALSRELAERISGQFQYIKWVSLQNAPPIKEILNDCLLFLSNQQESHLPEDVDEQISLIIQYLRKHRCLLILDKLEAVLKPKEPVGEYREGYEAYSRLINQIGETSHQSCLILTSREKPPALTRLPFTYLLHLGGVGADIARKILHKRGLIGSNEDWSALAYRYSGNPLMLEIAPETISTIFGGDISRFLKEEIFVFGDVDALLSNQFERLSTLEEDIIYWLAVERESRDSGQLLENLVLFVPKRALWEALKSLLSRHLIYQARSGFSMQDVIMEYVTNRLIDTMCDEISANQHHLFNSHALIKATAKEYIRQSQKRFILETMTTSLLGVYHSKEAVADRLMQVLSFIQEANPHKTGYAAGNVLNILANLECDLSGYDFSNLMIRQAYLQGVNLHNVDFSYSDLSDSVFTETFSGITSIAISPDGDLLAAGTEIGDIHIWKADRATYISALKGHSAWVRSVNFSPDGQLLASCSSDTTIRLWDVETSECHQILEGHTSRVRSAVFNQDGKILISASSDETIMIWSVSDGKKLGVLHGHKNVVFSLAFNSQDNTLFSGSFDNSIKVWDVKAGHLIKTLQGHEEAIMAIALSPQGDLLASGGADLKLRLWDVRSGNCLAILDGHTESIATLAFSPDGQLLASGSQDRTIRLWDSSSRACLRTLLGHTNFVEAVAFHPDNRTLFSGSQDQSIRTWDTRTGKQLRITQGYVDSAWIVAFHPDGNHIAVSGSDPTIRLWDINTAKPISEFVGHTNLVEAIAFNPEGTRMVSCGSDRTVRLWETFSGKGLQTLREHTRWVSFVAFSPDGRFVASCGEDFKVCLWDIEQSAVETLKGHTNSVRSVAFSCNGSLLASSDDDGVIRLWDIYEGTLYRTFEQLPKHTWSVAFDLETRFLASGSHDHIVRLWDIASGEIVQSLDDHNGWISTVAFSPDGQFLASASTDHSVRLWRVGSWELFQILDTGSQVWSFSFSPDSCQLVSGSNDETFKIWDLETGQCVKELANPKPYEDLNITGSTGLTPAQRIMIISLGAKVTTD